MPSMDVASLCVKGVKLFYYSQLGLSVSNKDFFGLFRLTEVKRCLTTPGCNIGVVVGDP